MKTTIVRATAAASAILIAYYSHRSNNTPAEISATSSADKSFSIVNLLNDPVDILAVDEYTGDAAFIETISLEQVIQYTYENSGVLLRFRRHHHQDFLFDEKIDEIHPHLVHIAEPEHIPHLRDYAAKTNRLWINNIGSGRLGHWIFPESNYGYNGSLDVVTDRVWFEKDNLSLIHLPVRWIANSPRIIHVGRLLSDWECDLLIEMARIRPLHRSKVDIANGTIGLVPTRTSSQTWVKTAESPAIQRISERIADLMHLDRKSIFQISESIQLLHYEKGSGYAAGHYDWFWPRKSLKENRSNRYATVFIYLNDVAEGGETAFFDQGASADDSTVQCSDAGIRVKPVKGSAVVFYNMLEDGNLDDKAMHAGCMPQSEDKFAANFWLWAQ